jgi:hypothetical protein
MSDRPAPGEWRTQIVVWDVRDPSKEGDPRFWWTPGEVGRMRRVAPPEHAVRITNAGLPKGRSLAAMRREFGGDEGVIFDGPAHAAVQAELLGRPVPPAPVMRLSLAHWRDADAQQTYLIVHYMRTPLPEEQSSHKPMPPELDQLRRDWVAALQAGDESEPMLRAQYEEESEAAGWFKYSRFNAFDERKASELSPGVFVQDERPGRT